MCELLSPPFPLQIELAVGKMVLNIKGGKTTSLKDKKKKKNKAELDESDLVYKKKQEEDARATAEMIKKLSKK